MLLLLLHLKRHGPGRIRRRSPICVQHRGCGPEALLLARYRPIRVWVGQQVVRLLLLLLLLRLPIRAGMRPPVDVLDGVLPRGHLVCRVSWGEAGDAQRILLGALLLRRGALRIRLLPRLIRSPDGGFPLVECVRRHLRLRKALRLCLLLLLR